jgi:hypothetical protein
MKILIRTQQELNQYLERVVECAFREGMMYAECGQDICSISEAIEFAKINIIYDGQL